MNNFDIDIEWASKMLSSEIGAYLFSLWNGDDVTRKHYSEVLYHYSYVFNALQIEAKIIYDYEGCRTPKNLPVGFSICGVERNVFDYWRKKWEEQNR